MAGVAALAAAPVGLDEQIAVFIEHSVGRAILRWGDEWRGHDPVLDRAADAYARLSEVKEPS